VNSVAANPEVRTKRHETVTVSELVDDYVGFLSSNHAKSVGIIERVLNNLRRHKVYRGRLAASITSEDNEDYRKARLKEHKSEATCNNELSYLRSAFIHGMRKQTHRRFCRFHTFQCVFRRWRSLIPI